MKTRERIFFVRVTEIDWIEAVGNYARIYSGPRRHLVRTTIRQLLDELDPEVFIRINRGAIINLDNVLELQPLLSGIIAVLKGGTRLKVTRSNRDSLTVAFERAAYRPRR